MIDESGEWGTRDEKEKRKKSKNYSDLPVSNSR